jgi:hypothetical protein
LKWDLLADLGLQVPFRFSDLGLQGQVIGVMGTIGVMGNRKEKVLKDFNDLKDPFQYRLVTSD